VGKCNDTKRNKENRKYGRDIVFLGRIVALLSNMEPVFEEVSVRERITENNLVVPEIRVPTQVSILCDGKIP
jgi:hypothetical protein